MIWPQEYLEEPPHPSKALSLMGSKTQAYDRLIAYQWFEELGIISQSREGLDSMVRRGLWAIYFGSYAHKCGLTKLALEKVQDGSFVPAGLPSE